MRILLDDKDRHLLKNYTWSPMYRAHTTYLRYCYWVDGKQKAIYLHRILTKATPEQHVHHINGNGLDNRRCNLQVLPAGTHMSRTQHAAAVRRGPLGSTKYHGVVKARNKWRAIFCRPDSTKVNLGTFRTAEEAARAWDRAALKYRGPNTYLNFGVQ